ncbi:hypothetical protein F5Y09DRAFT_118782 [Xylaria sp. FL1042]|nr:hypothetical protein F5Y09DRAFT_118782 [Xylaria sp. FL1042]
MAIPQSRASARKLVQKITRDHGFVSPERLQQLETFNPELRRDIEEALLTKDKLIGSSVLTLATNLYTSKARFVFELLQNADDNMYERAKASGDAPYVSFHVHPNCIVVECNEDGFTDGNLTAICAIGKSSKTGDQRYIGEKGIGFKSVFMAAWKVHIQSGMLSFSFRHRIGDSGMGMISPLWEETDDGTELPLPLTRFTLYLHDDGDPEMLSKARQSIEMQFEDLQETMLLFMKNLQKIHVVLYDETSQQMSSTTYSIERPRDTYAILKRIRAIGGKTEETVKRYHITTHRAINLAKNENRTYSADEVISRVYATSQIVLAFPLSESHIPIVEPQDLFVFLPVRQVGFNFLIHADFVTDANRQDVVQDSLRNSGLIDAVADAFIKAMLQLCEDDALPFQWMRYLPEKEDKKWSGLWLSLVQCIKHRMNGTAILYDRHHSRKRYMEDLRCLTRHVMDANGDPLFATRKILSQIISEHYKSTDLLTLKDYGLRECTYSDFIGWIRKDLRSGVLSRIRSPTTSDDWHYRVARQLDRPFQKEWRALCTEVKKLELIPVNDGSWVSGDRTSVYFQKVDDLEIPSNIDLRLVAKNVVDPHRLALFKKLGVMTAPIRLVRDSILRFYDKSTPDIETSLQHLKFLYLTETEDEEFPDYEELKLFDQHGNIVKPFTDCIYITNNDSYGGWELFRSKPDVGIPGFPANFVHQKYFEDPPAETGDEWVDWFYDALNVRRVVYLGYGKHGQEELNYIQTYRPEKLLGAIHEIYQRFPDTLSLCGVTNNIAVLCPGNRKVPLKNTYFPTTDLVDRAEKLLGQGVFFPWLQLEFENASSRIPPTWKSLLELLGVPVLHTDVDFALSMFKYLRDAFYSEAVAPDTSRLCELYDHIQEKCWGSEHRIDETRKVRAFFSLEPSIYIPGSQITWASLDECVWDAPQEMETKYVLKQLYGSCSCRRGDKCPYFTDFFVETLGIRAYCTWEDYIEELEELKDACDDVDTIMGIYEGIDSLPLEHLDIDAIREVFENKALIYASVDNEMSWYKPSQCVWSTSALLKGKVSLNEDYEDLDHLFTQVLGVKRVDLQMAIDDLKLTSSQPSVSVAEMKESIWTVNSLLSTESSPPNPSEIIQRSIFPVRHPFGGGIICETVKVEFFIVDREQLKRSFSNKVKLLDFSLKEVSHLRPFLQWCGFQGRYLSCCVKEVTSFPGEGASLVSTPSLQIRHKAHAFLRIACHFNSPRSRSAQDLQCLYGALKNARIFETDAISSNLRVLQDKEVHEVESSRTTLHINENALGLNVYIPRKKDDQQFILSTKLAESLLNWMMTHPTTQICDGIEGGAVNATRDVFLVPYAKLSEALEENGIATIDLENTDEILPGSDLVLTPFGVSVEGIRNLDIHDEDATEYDGVSTPISGAESATASYNASSYSPERRSSVENSFTRVQISSIEHPALPRDGTADSHYIATLSRAITAGRRDNIPVHGESNRERTSSSRHEAVYLGLGSPSQGERNYKVGAAGELYVFELLSHLSGAQGLPAFNSNNWKSNIRKHVTVHPEYADMEDWRGSETSDITYSDVQGVLTDELIEKGYLAQDLWGGKRPNYFIEVKSTTSSCETPFYMSKGQYRRMQNNTNQQNHASATIYVIFRVYWLGQDNVGLRIYLDPESLRRTHQLEFTSELWSVVPGLG